MSCSDLIALNEAITNTWDTFVKDAPPSWKSDGWLESRRPLGVIAAYGQNLPIRTGDDASLDEAHWTASRDFSKARFLSTALATHVESVSSLSFILLY